MILNICIEMTDAAGEQEIMIALAKAGSAAAEQFHGWNDNGKIGVGNEIDLSLQTNTHCVTASSLNRSE